MKRSVARILCCGSIITALGVSGCGGGGMEEGMPKDTTSTVPPEMLKADMSKDSKAKKPGPTAKP